jgi:surface carbohydrate biosynthesis protein
MRLDLSPRRWILSPIAIKARDLDGNALLAFTAAERGFGVLLGNIKLKNKPYTPPGFVILKNLRPGKATQLVQDTHANGQKVGAWCDEGLIYKDPETYCRLKFDRRAYELVDTYFTWGRNQTRDLVEKLACNGEKIRVTGNPRFDVHRPDLRAVLGTRAERIRRRYGRYVLVNTKFSTFNGFAGSEKNVSGMRARGMLQTAEHEDEAKGLQAFQGTVFTAFMQLVDELSRRLPEHTIIVRPHPSENHAPWRARAATLPNVKVLFQGNVAEWILGSDICIHNNCTTGVEAYMLGKPAVSYRPVCDSRYDLFLPNALSSEAYDLPQLMQMVHAALQGTALKQGKEWSDTAKTARDFIANLDGRWASEEILDVIEQIDLPEAPLNVQASGFERLTAGARRYLRSVRELTAPDDATTQERFAKQKFDGLPRSEVVDFLRAAQKATGRFADVQVSQLEHDIVCIY